MMLCYSKTRKIKYFLDPPPPKKKAQGYERSRYVYTHKFLYITVARDLDILSGICPRNSSFVKAEFTDSDSRMTSFEVIMPL